MAQKVIFTGLFTTEGIMTPSHHRYPQGGMLHVTHQFKPEHPRLDLVGTTVVLEIIGYGNDGHNEAVLVQPMGEIPDWWHEIAVPHITISWTPDSTPVKSGQLHFSSVPRGEFVVAKYGYFDGKEVHI